MNMLEYPYNTCHMTHGMIQLSYGNEREMNDGARTSSTSQIAWMELIQAQEARKSILLCSQVEARRYLHHVRNQVTRTNIRGGVEENQSFLTGILPVAPKLLPELVEGASNNPYLMLPVVILSMHGRLCQIAMHAFV
jgi:hypothetical protein